MSDRQTMVYDASTHWNLSFRVARKLDRETPSVNNTPITFQDVDENELKEFFISETEYSISQENIDNYTKSDIIRGLFVRDIIQADTADRNTPKHGKNHAEMHANNNYLNKKHGDIETDILNKSFDQTISMLKEGIRTTRLSQDIQEKLDTSQRVTKPNLRNSKLLEAINRFSAKPVGNHEELDGEKDAVLFNDLYRDSENESGLLVHEVIPSKKQNLSELQNIVEERYGENPEFGNNPLPGRLEIPYGMGEDFLDIVTEKGYEVSFSETYWGKTEGAVTDGTTEVETAMLNSIQGIDPNAVVLMHSTDTEHLNLNEVRLDEVTEERFISKNDYNKFSKTARKILGHNTGLRSYDVEERIPSQEKEGVSDEMIENKDCIVKDISVPSIFRKDTDYPPERIAEIDQEQFRIDELEVSEDMSFDEIEQIYRDKDLMFENSMMNTAIFEEKGDIIDKQLDEDPEFVLVGDSTQTKNQGIKSKTKAFRLVPTGASEAETARQILKHIPANHLTSEDPLDEKVSYSKTLPKNQKIKSTRYIDPGKGEDQNPFWVSVDSEPESHGSHVGSRLFERSGRPGEFKIPEDYIKSSLEELSKYKIQPSEDNSLDEEKDIEVAVTPQALESLQETGFGLRDLPIEARDKMVELDRDPDGSDKENTDLEKNQGSTITM